MQKVVVAGIEVAKRDLCQFYRRKRPPKVLDSLDVLPKQPLGLREIVLDAERADPSLGDSNGNG